MDFKSFMGVIKTVTSIPKGYFTGRLSDGIVFSENHTNQTFFKNHPARQYPISQRGNTEKALQSLSTTYVSYLISQTKEYGFYKSIKGGADAYIDNWFLQNGNIVGQNMLVDYLLQPTMLGSYGANPGQLAKDIADNTASNTFITALLVECDAIGSLLPAKVLLLMLKLIDNSGENYRKVHKVWVGNQRWEEIKDYETHNWLTVCRDSFRQNMPVYSKLLYYIRSAMTVSTIISEPPPPDPWQAYGGFAVGDTVTGYGMAVNDWIGNVAKPAGLFSGTKADNIKSSSDGCLAAGTALLMADGSLKRIEDIVSGDALLTANDSIAICSGELTPNDSVKAFYGINDEKPCMSFGHMIMTQRGWCSLSPSISHANHPHLEISKLEIGDIVWKVKSVNGKEISYDKVAVERINIHNCESDGPLIAYALHQRGDKTNHPNGYCCHSGYPDISIHHIAGNVASRMETSEQLQFYQDLEEMAPQLEKALGTGAFSLVMASLKNIKDTSKNIAHMSNHGKVKSHYKGAKHVVLPHVKLTPLQGEGDMLDQLDDFAIVKGHCFIGGCLVETAINDSIISWKRSVDGLQEEGAIQMFHHGLLGKGHVVRGDKSVSFLANVLNTYDVVLGTNHKPWLQFEMGPEADEKGNPHMVGFLKDPTDDENTKLLRENSSVVFSQVERKDHMEVLHAKISFSPSFCAFGGSDYYEIEYNFTLNYETFSGKAIKYDESQSDYIGEEVVIFGKSEDIESLIAHRNALSQKMKKLPLQKQRLNQAQAPTFESNAAIEAMAIAKTPSELFTLPMPDLKAIHEESFDKLKDMMMLAVSKKDAQEFAFFGEKAPTVGPGMDLSSEMGAMLDKDEMSNFFVDKFATGYLTQAFSKSDDDKIKPHFDGVDNVDEKLSYFWKGDGDKSFATDPSYTVATSLLNDFVYINNVDGLADYVHDGGEKWAKELFDYCMHPPTLMGLAMQNTLDGRKRLTHLCSMLQALDSTGRVKLGDKTASYSVALYQSVVELRLSDFIKKAKVQGKDDFNEFLIEYFKQYIASITDSSSSWSAEVRAKALQELHELMEATNSKTAMELSANLRSIISNASSFLGAIRNGPIGVKIQKWAKAIESDGSILKALGIKGARIFGSILTMGVYAFGASQVISAFFNWDKMSVPEKISLVATTLNITSSVFKDISAWRYAKVLSSSESKMSEIIEAINYVERGIEDVGVLHFTDEIVEGLDMDFPSLLRGGRTIAEGITEAESLAASVAKWEKIAAVGEVVSRSFGIIALGAAAVVTGFAIANDFATGQPASIIALDIISEISTAVSFIVEVGSGIAALLGVEVLAAIPVIGVIAAVVGILVSFIMLFIHRNPPPSPLEVFVRDTCVPFIQNLPMPSEKWLNKQKKAAEHLSGGKTSNILAMI